MSTPEEEPTNRQLAEILGQLVNVLLVSATLVGVLKVVSLFWGLGAKILSALILVAAVLDAVKNSFVTVVGFSQHPKIFSNPKGLAFVILGLLHDFLPVAILVWAVRWLGFFFTAVSI